MRCFAFTIILILATSPLHGQVDANRLTYLDEPCDPYYPSLGLAKLTTPQWVGDEDVEAVITLGIDDMRDIDRYESYLRPILERLKQIDGRAPVSIMTNSINPDEPQLQVWLQEGLSIETHTADHPCPCLQGGDFAQAKDTYDRCVEQISSIPGNRPVAFRFPCMDSMNTPSPRAFAEIVNKTTDSGKFLQASSSVLVLLTANDPSLAAESFWDTDGNARFEKYLPFKSFVNKIEDYPYPYIIGQLCWEFPVAIPDDWQGQNLHGAFNPQTTEDIKAVVDATVVKQGMANITFHPGGWIRNEQVVSVVDHAVRKHGRKVLFLNFRECVARINQHLLSGHPIRSATGEDNGVRLADLNADGYLDVCISNESMAKTRVWLPKEKKWHETSFPTPIVRKDERGRTVSSGVRFGVIRKDGHASILVCNETVRGGWHFDGQQWIEDPSLIHGLELDDQPLFTSRNGSDTGVRFRDIDNDGCGELLIGNPKQNAIWTWKQDGVSSAWEKAPSALPAGTMIVDAQGRDAGLRFVDLDEDRFDDVVFSNESHASIHLFSSVEKGWSRRATPTERENGRVIPMISRNGTNNGAWFAARHMWLQHEGTNRLPDGIERRSFIDLLGDQDPLPKNPQSALRSIRVPDGFRVELVAAEPLVQDPIAFDWGPDGKLWVVEMADYPLGLNNDGTPGGRIRYLEDADHDGQYEKSTLFLDGIPYPTGVMPWRDGVLVSAAPEIFFAADTDGDGKADTRETLYRGFAEGNQQHRVNGFAWGLDNWIYLANGDSGGQIESLQTGESIDISGRDLRIRPETGEMDPQTGQTQFGRRRDDWGNWFSCTNSIPIRHVALADHYLRRNPHYAPPSPLRVLADTRNTRLNPISRILSHWEGYRPPRGDEPHFFTSASGTDIYRDDLFGPRFANTVFTCEPVHNMIHRQILEVEGTTFSSHRAPDEAHVEFLASSDSWFRPTTVKTGPDGALWLADMYRLVIEHTAYIDDRREETLNLRAGEDRGRIYRIVPLGNPVRKMQKLDKRNVPQLAAALGSPNGWTRDMAQRLLIQANRKQATEHVSRRLAESSSALTRLHAMCTLDGLGTLTTRQILAALDDSHAGVRRHAIRIAESRLSDTPTIMSKLLQMSDDDAPQVLLQLAYTLGESRDEQVGKVLGRILIENHGDEYLQAAVLSSLHEQNITAAVNVVLSAENDRGSRVDDLLTPLLEIATAYEQPDALLHAFRDAISPAEIEAAGLRQVTRLLQIAKRHKIELTSLDAVSTKRLKELVIDLEARISDPASNLDFRLAAVGLFGWTPSEDAGTRHEVLIGLLDPQNAPALQQAALAALAGATDSQVATELLTRWRRLSPTVRTDVLDLLLTRKTWTAAIVRQLERGELTVGDLSPSHQQRLLLHDDKPIRERAKSALNRVTPTDRTELIQSYRSALKKIEGSKVRGKTLFATHCSACHKVHSLGHAVGPDLLGLKNRTEAAILVAILDPNRSIEDKYRSYTVHTVEGQSLAGVLASESSNSLTLKMKNGKQQVILRRDIEELASSMLSLMPEGMEKVLPQRSMADLLAYVADLGPPPKKFSGNSPRLIEAGEDGELELPVSASRIYGSTVVFEPRYGNLGYWQSEDDQAEWSIEVGKSGVYEVLLEYACDNGTANNPFTLQIGSRNITGRVAGTGTWDDYRKVVIGRIQIEAGSQQAVFRSQGEINNCLIDLRTIVIRPSAAD